MTYMTGSRPTPKVAAGDDGEDPAVAEIGKEAGQNTESCQNQTPSLGVDHSGEGTEQRTNNPGSGSNGPIGARKPFAATARQTAVRQFLALRPQGNPQECFQ
ncbi:hypothetical protein TRIATDRAFT_279387 [Trichoderma atroviride IMI 206040]|uniref:Uncharacterized protein n=1 Tax=Hypocrea atroviridis (strain ATCC 20476 / IMI 206040) TaxID=452589 RepID=G9PB74_HYPAI|nr:uncharacterized protein TRIATDRAFT_279387 [Trichoderma atroviride IMI 206040]EHK39623.1 hypothetical protein TRIATDRAFT_279387 [Trichoderma atroviride IMI 206040]